MKKSLFQTIILWILVVVILGSVVLIGSNAYSIWSAYGKIKENYKNSFEVFVNELKQENTSVSNFLLTYMETSDVKSFCYRNDSDYFVSSRIRDQLQTTLLLEKYTSGFWIYSEIQKREMWIRNSNQSQYEQMEAIRQIFGRTKNLKMYYSNSWNLVKLLGKEYLVFYYSDGAMCVGAWYDTDIILDRSEEIFVDGNIKTRFLTGEDRKDTEWDFQFMQKLQEFPEIWLSVQNLDFDRKLFSTVIIGLLIFSLICIVSMGILIWNLRRYLVKPVDEITGAICRIGKGELDYRLTTGSYVCELAEIGDNLNKMSEHIQRLKISVYEEELQKKEAQFQFQNAQIRPHFMLNAINSVYSMTGVGEQESVMKICRYLSNYMRYVFTEKDMLCTLKEEILHLQEYLKIQEIRFPGEMEYDLDVDPLLMETVIPTMSIHTLVENTFKYAFGGRESLCAGLIGCLENQHTCRIEIWDNGPGFYEELRTAINNGSYARSEPQKAVGICNTIRRFENVYGKQFTILVENEPCTRIVLRFPYITDKEKWERGIQNEDFNRR